jgi:hypothetical protein
LRNAVSQLRKNPIPVSPWGQRGDVDAAAERAAGAADDDHANAIVGGEIVDQRVEVERPLFVRAVEHVRPVQRHGRDRLFDSRVHGFKVHETRV